MNTFNKSKFEYLRDALNHTGKYTPGAIQAIDKYPREGAAKYAARCALAWTTKDLHGASARFAGHLSSKPTTREANGEFHKKFIDDCNGKGDSLSVFFGDFAVQLKARGTMFLLVDMPKTLPENKADQIDARAFPYVVPIYPEDVVEVSLGKFGAVKSISVNVSAESDGKQIDAVKTWDLSSWKIEADGRVIDSGTYSIGVCPVLAVAESEVGQTGEFAQIAHLSHRLLNMRSELDELLRSQTFSVLAVQIPKEAAAQYDEKTGAAVAATLSTKNMLNYFGEAPGFIAPPDGPAATYMACIKSLEESIKQVSHDIQSDSGGYQNQSGVALQIRYQALNAALAEFSRKLEDLERRVWDLFNLWLGTTEDVSISWPKQFNLVDSSALVAMTQELIDMGAPESFRRAALKRLVQSSLGDLPPSEMEKLLSDIDLSEFEVTP